MTKDDIQRVARTTFTDTNRTEAMIVTAAPPADDAAASDSTGNGTATSGS